MWRLIYFVPTWLIFVVFRTIFIVIGWLLVPIAAMCGAYKWVDDFDGAGNPRKEAHFTWKIMYIFDNYEDGCADTTYWRAPKWLGKYRTATEIIYWSCLRNPVNNLRTIPIITCKINPEKVKWIGTYGTDPGKARMYNREHANWFIAWCGLYSNVLVCFYLFDALYCFRLGWKIYPSDTWGVSPYRKEGAGFAIQFKKR